MAEALPVTNLDYTTHAFNWWTPDENPSAGEIVTADSDMIPCVWQSRAAPAIGMQAMGATDFVWTWWRIHRISVGAEPPGRCLAGRLL